MPEGTPTQKTIVHNVAHMRRLAGGDAELISQLILGQMVVVHEHGAHWSYVESEDGYRGWVENRWLADAPAAPLTPVSAVFAEVLAEPSPAAALRLRLPILAGVRRRDALPESAGWISVDAGGIAGWLPAIDLEPLDAPPGASHIPGCAVENAGRFLGTPYLWGGTTPFGLDCSGMVQLCYRLAGLLLPRDAWMQRDDPRFVPVALADLAPGDLIFFGRPHRITHVALQWGERQFIHASSGAGVALSTWGDPPYSERAVDARRLDPARASDCLMPPEIHRDLP